MSMSLRELKEDRAQQVLFAEMRKEKKDLSDGQIWEILYRQYCRYFKMKNLEKKTQKLFSLNKKKSKSVKTLRG